MPAHKESRKVLQRSPRFLTQVLEVVADMKRGAPYDRILDEVQAKVRGTISPNTSPQSLIKQLRLTIKHAITKGVLQRCAGRIMMTVGIADIDGMPVVSKATIPSLADTSCASSVDSKSIKSEKDFQVNKAKSAKEAKTAKDKKSIVKRLQQDAKLGSKKKAKKRGGKAGSRRSIADRFATKASRPSSKNLKIFDHFVNCNYDDSSYHDMSMRDSRHCENPNCLCNLADRNMRQ